MEEILIRKANVDDAKKIYDNLKLCSEDMYQKLGLEHWIPVYPKNNIVEDIKNKDVFIVEYNKKVIGNFILDTKKSYLWENEKKAVYLSKLAIIPEFANRGFGKKCMQFIEQHARKESCEFVRFDVYEKSINTVEFYKKLNYEIVKEAKTRRFKVLLMEKRI